MGKKIAKGKKGERSQYLTRSKAIRKLQLSLKDFRRLCILKGVYPREPKKKFEGTNKTYYHVKDIKILQHDKLLDKFRELKAHAKKYKKLISKKENKLAEQHLKNAPKYSLSHIIKERYPTFMDALRDLDDALCLISLFANLPQHHTLEITKKQTETCNQLVKEFMLYCTVTQCFKKAFFSIKGIYYQAEIMGQSITWISPYAFNQKLPFDIDYKVMSTFLEFYIALVRFVNHKLFVDLGFKHPLPAELVNMKNEDTLYLDVQQVQQMQKQARKKFEQAQNEKGSQKYAISEEFKDTPEMKKLTKKEEQNKRQRSLFSKCVFLLNRETPIYSLQYLILSFGGLFATEDNVEQISQQTQVTHHVMDRPLAQGVKLVTNREYVQPQWIVDSLNNLYLLPVQSYKPGQPLPPHLSPFVDDVKEGYIPSRQKEINALKGEVVEVEEEEQEDDEQMQDNQESEDEI